MTEFAKDLWKRVAPAYHYWLMAVAIGQLAEHLKPGLFFPVGLAVLFTANAYRHTVYVEDD